MNLFTKLIPIEADMGYTNRLLRSGIFADAKIQLGESGRIWNVHTTIVCVQSKYLEAAFVGKYSVSKSVENTLVFFGALLIL